MYDRENEQDHEYDYYDQHTTRKTRKRKKGQIAIAGFIFSIIALVFGIGIYNNMPQSGNQAISQQEEQYQNGEADQAFAFSENNPQDETESDLIFVHSTAYNNAADMFRAIENSVVSINMTATHQQFHMIREVQGAGSGIIFHETDEHIYIVTNYHVVENATSVTISLDDVRTAPANFVGGYESSDLAVISVLKSNLEQAGITGYELAAFGNSDNIEIGNFVLAVGNAHGIGQSATLGIISAKNRNINIGSDIELNVIQTDAAINPGNSGGPLVDTFGQVIGINTAKFMSDRSEGMGYAIPSNEVVKVIQQIMERGNMQTPMLGVTMATVTQELRDEYNLDDVGVLVADIVRGMAASNMGIMRGDVVTHYNGIRVMTSGELGRLISQTEVGATIEITVLRFGRGEPLTMTGTMTAYSTSTTNF